LTGKTVGGAPYSRNFITKIKIEKERCKQSKEYTASDEVRFILREFNLRVFRNFSFQELIEGGSSPRILPFFFQISHENSLVLFVQYKQFESSLWRGTQQKPYEEKKHDV
jgi:hypothetical protein